MHKLYKYLFFGVEVEFETTGYTVTERFDTTQIGILSGIYEEKGKIIARIICKDNSIKHILLNKCKPILHPFSDLTKSLPLTKAAAELLQMKEGEMVVPLRHLSDKIKNIFDLFEGLVVEFKTSHMIEHDTDFLRAMHFNLDFAESEFVPKNE